MHYARVTGDDSYRVRRKTVEEYYVWLESAYEEEKKVYKERGL